MQQKGWILLARNSLSTRLPRWNPVFTIAWQEIHRELEREVAKYLSKEDALVLGMGWGTPGWRAGTPTGEQLAMAMTFWF